MVNKPDFANGREETAWILEQIVADDVVREKLIGAMLDKREFPAGHIGERQYRDDTNGIVRANVEGLLSKTGLRKFWDDCFPEKKEQPVDEPADTNLGTVDA